MPPWAAWIEAVVLPAPKDVAGISHDDNEAGAAYLPLAGSSTSVDKRHPG